MVPTVDHMNMNKSISISTQTKQTTQYNRIQNKQMSILQSPKSNTVHNIIIKQYNTNYNKNNLSN